MAVLNFYRLPYTELVSGKLGSWKSKEMIFLTGRLAVRRGREKVRERKTDRQTDRGDKQGACLSIPLLFS